MFVVVDPTGSPPGSGLIASPVGGVRDGPAARCDFGFALLN